mmetsp:Transcript_436/g.1027  ORF Transcript_436/g.1027 Transcript_436/m.1027 type:complete len:559 (+) Transcript_436:207-1883(+)
MSVPPLTMKSGSRLGRSPQVGKKLVIQSPQVVLPDRRAPQEATIFVVSGVIDKVLVPAQSLKLPRTKGFRYSQRTCAFPAPSTYDSEEELQAAIATFKGEGGPDFTLLQPPPHIIVLPGLVDSHVHLNDIEVARHSLHPEATGGLPGSCCTPYTVPEEALRDWEGYDSGTRAAAAGGITTVADMPLNGQPVSTSAAAVHTKRHLHESLENRQLHVDVGILGGVIPGNVKELMGMADAGAVGFKCFMVYSGIEDFPACKPRDMEDALAMLRRMDIPLMIHAECFDNVDVSPFDREDPTHYKTFLNKCPPEAEFTAIEGAITAAENIGAAVHIVHLSAASALPIIRRARADLLPLTVETCPHYLSLCEEQIHWGCTHYKCCPPIRHAQNREALWEGLLDGTIDMIVSDHSPCPVSLKHLDTGDFTTSWGGLSTLQLSLAIIWTEAHKRSIPIERLAYWMAMMPAHIIGMGRTKGAIAAGYSADFAFFDPTEVWVVEAERMFHKHKICPFEGLALRGRVQKTLLRGITVFDRSQADLAQQHPNLGTGRFVARPIALSPRAT